MKSAPVALRFPLPLLLIATAAAQGPAPGHRLYQVAGSTETRLVDATNTELHVWPGRFPAINAYLLADGSLLRATVRSAFTIPGTTGGVERVALDGTVLWDYQHHGADFTSHHDIAPLANGNVLLIVWEFKTAAEAVAAGRDPALLPHTHFYVDSVVEVEPTGPTSGRVVWEWHLWDHLVQDFDPTAANFGPVANQIGRVDINYPPTPLPMGSAGAWNHVNGIDHDPIHDWIVLSARHQHEVWILDHSTSTAAAAGSSGGRWGRGGELLYRWGNPEAYRAGTVADRQLVLQHDPRFVPPGHPGAGNLTIFNNQWQPNQSAVFEIALPLDQVGNLVLGGNGRYGPAGPLWQFSTPQFFSSFVSSAQRLPNGNTLVASGSQGGMFEVDHAGALVWLYAPPGLTQPIFQVHYVDRLLWASTALLPAGAGGRADLDLIAGAPAGGYFYFVLGSASGTTPGLPWSGLHIPLNNDFLFASSLGLANSGPFVNTLGTLDPLGRATAGLLLQPGQVPPPLVGLAMDFAAVLFDPSLLPRAATNAVRVGIGP